MRQDKKVDVLTQLLRQYELADRKVLLHVGDNRPRLARHAAHLRSYVAEHGGAGPNPDPGRIGVLQFRDHPGEVVFEEAITLELEHGNDTLGVTLLADQAEVDLIAAFIERQALQAGLHHDVLRFRKRLRLLLHNRQVTGGYSREFL